MRLPRRDFVKSLAVTGLFATPALAADALAKAKPKAVAGKAPAEPVLEFPPKLPGGKTVVTDTSAEFLQVPEGLRGKVDVATAAPTVDFLYYPGQDYPGKIWSVWGEGTVSKETGGKGKYYSAIGDHLAPAGTARVFEYDPEQKTLRTLLDLKTLLKQPEGTYSASKIHSRTELASDGWVYCSTHRGSPSVTNDKYHYQGDWIVRCHPQTGASEIVAAAPVPKHCIPTGRIDPDRMIFYGATSPGEGKEELGQFFAYDLRQHRVLYAGPGGPSRSMILARSTGKVYFTPGPAGAAEGPLMRFDPEHPSTPSNTGLTMGIRAAADETSDGIVYAVSHEKAESGSKMFRFDTKTEKLTTLGPAAIGENQYIASLGIDASGKYIYYVSGAHGGSERDGTALVQFNTRTNRKKVVAFLEPFYTQHYGCTLKGTYSVAVDPQQDKVYITWNVSRGSKAWDCCGLTVVHIPASERSVKG